MHWHSQRQTAAVAGNIVGPEYQRPASHTLPGGILPLFHCSSKGGTPIGPHFLCSTASKKRGKYFGTTSGHQHASTSVFYPFLFRSTLSVESVLPVRPKLNDSKRL